MDISLSHFELHDLLRGDRETRDRFKRTLTNAQIRRYEEAKQSSDWLSPSQVVMEVTGLHHKSLPYGIPMRFSSIICEENREDWVKWPDPLSKKTTLIRRGSAIHKIAEKRVLDFVVKNLKEILS